MNVRDVLLIATCMVSAGRVSVGAQDSPRENASIWRSDRDAAEGARIVQGKRRCADDSAGLVAFMTAQGYALEAVAAQDRKYCAVIAQPTAGGLREIVGLILAADSFALIEGPVEIGDFTPASVRWVELGGDSIDALVITFDDPIEGSVGSVVYHVSDGTLIRTYADGIDSCRPGDLRDLDGDGRPELITHVEDPSGGDCGDECHLELWERFETAPAWVRVYRWKDSEWTPAEAEFPGFYADLARRYERVQRWLDGPVDHGLCERVYWLRDRRIFGELAKRARAIAESRRWK